MSPAGPKLSPVSYAIALGGAAVAVCLAFPPWTFTHSRPGAATVRNDAGYSFIFNPPVPGGRSYDGVELDLDRLLVQALVIALLTAVVALALRGLVGRRSAISTPTGNAHATQSEVSHTGGATGDDKRLGLAWRVEAVRDRLHGAVFILVAVLALMIAVMLLTTVPGDETDGWIFVIQLLVITPIFMALIHFAGILLSGLCYRGPDSDVWHPYLLGIMVTSVPVIAIFISWSS